MQILYMILYITSRFLESTSFSKTINANTSSVNNLHQFFETVTLQNPHCQSKLSCKKAVHLLTNLF